MSLTTGKLIANAVTIEGYINPVSYDPTRDLHYGQWLCSHCKSFDAGWKKPIHKMSCPLRNQRTEADPCAHSAIIYILGEHEQGFYSPYELTDIAKIKTIAKQSITAADDVSQSSDRLGR